MGNGVCFVLFWVLKYIRKKKQIRVMGKKY